jgi:hypothetical protein
MERSVRLRTEPAAALFHIGDSRHRRSVDRREHAATAPQGYTKMAKIHRKAADGRPMKPSVSQRSMAHLGMGIEAPKALDEWEAEGGATIGAGRTGENDAASRSLLDRLLLERLGAALVTEWSNLPVRLQRTVYERAVSVSSPSNRPTIRRQMARFLHDHKTRARRAPRTEVAHADAMHGTS